ncbi:unnamed protein product [Schistocephalus solidus]|uniref:Uncharacterized protein n=1 Tax=Schistocephalus solidus TaxID=70667 RepID=A0A183TMK8_SCHSO|nr:unnamed protein product [Schistocephalus solidus]
MLLWPPLTGTALSPVAPRSWVLPSGHTPGNRHDRRAKPGQGLRCASTPGMSDFQTSQLFPLKKSYGGGNSNPQPNNRELGEPAWKHDGANCEISSSPPPSKSSDALAVKPRTGLTTMTPTSAKKNGLHKAYMDIRTDATKAAFFRCWRLVQQRLREMQDAWTKG